MLEFRTDAPAQNANGLSPLAMLESVVTEQKNELFSQIWVRLTVILVFMLVVWVMPMVSHLRMLLELLFGPLGFPSVLPPGPWETYRMMLE